jgi:sec-independent protein translocase protein TatA
MEMIGDLFDSPWKILIVAIVIIVLFGSAKLPMAARSLGKSMRILKTEVSSLHDDDGETKDEQSPAAATASLTTAAPVAPAAAAQPFTQQSVEDVAQQVRINSLEEQIRELKESADQKAAVPADQQPR